MNVGNVVAIGSLVFVGITMLVNALQSYELTMQTRFLAEATRATNKINTASVSLNINSTMHDLSRMLIKRPELYAYIYGDLPLPEEEPIRTRVLAASEMFIDFMSMTLDQAPLLADETAGVWRRYFADLVARSAVLQHCWRETRNWYETPVRSLLDPVVFPDGVPVEVGAGTVAGGGALAVVDSPDEVAGETAQLNLGSPGAAESHGAAPLSQESARHGAGPMGQLFRKLVVRESALDKPGSADATSDEPAAGGDM